MPEPIDKIMALYVHVPFCEAKCRYCSFYSVAAEGHDVERVVSAIVKEMDMYDLSNSVTTVYIGGGSPSCLPQGQLFRLVCEAAARCPAAEEFTVEINPGQADERILSRLRQTGVNRLSIGAQSFDNDELQTLGRRHTAGQITGAVEKARKSGFENIGLDLISAIPGSTLKSLQHSLQSAIDLKVEHISVYSLTYEKDTPLQKAVCDGQVVPVDEETDCVMYEMTIDVLGAAGFQQYEISNFARASFQCRHNLNYWANGSYIGVGPAAASYAVSCVSNKVRRRRTVNISDIKEYVRRIEAGQDAVAESEESDGIGAACETAVLNLRRREGIVLAEFKDLTGFDAKELFAGPIRQYLAEGLLAESQGRIFLTRRALPIADAVMVDFSTV